MHRTLGLTALLLLLTVGPASAQKDKDPVYLDMKKSQWIEMLKTDENARRRKTAVQALAAISNEHPATSKEIFGVLGATLKSDPHLTVRRQAAIVFGQSALKILEKTSDVDPRSVIADLAEVLRTEKETEVRKELAVALGLYGKGANVAISPLQLLIKDADPGVRAAVVETLGRIGPDAKGAATDILALLNDMEESVRAASIFALGRITPDESAKVAGALVPHIKKETNPDLRKAAVTSLCLLNDRSATVVQSIAGGLTDENLEVRQAAAQGLVKLGPAVKLIEAELNKTIKEDKHASVRVYAVRTLSEGFGSDARLLLPFFMDRLKEDKDTDVRITLIEEIGKIVVATELKKEDTDKVMVTLRECQRDPLQPIREAATEAVKRITRGKPKQ